MSIRIQHPTNKIIPRSKQDQAFDAAIDKHLEEHRAIDVTDDELERFGDWLIDQVVKRYIVTMLRSHNRYIVVTGQHLCCAIIPLLHDDVDHKFGGFSEKVVKYWSRLFKSILMLYTTNTSITIKEFLPHLKMWNSSSLINYSDIFKDSLKRIFADRDDISGKLVIHRPGEVAYKVMYIRLDYE